MLISILLFLNTSLVGQDHSFIAVNTPEAEYRKLLDASKKVTSVSCDFVQYKELSILSDTITSEGLFRLKNNDKLLWEYKTPYPYKVIINEDKMLVDNSDSKMTFDIRSNRMFREISDIMIRSVDGTIITDKSAFDTELFENRTELQAVLRPKTKALGALFESIKLYFSKKNYQVNKIEMNEEMGDVTTIVLKNQKFNEHIENKIFDIDN